MEEALEFYSRGLIHPTFSKRPLNEINEVLDEMDPGSRLAAGR
jgi:propanol-preferring alcohol dehydrogenase